MFQIRPSVEILPVAVAIVITVSSAFAQQPGKTGREAKAGATRISAERILFAIIGDYGTGGQSEADVAAMVASWGVDFVATVGDNNYPDGAESTIDRNVGRYYSDFIHPYAGAHGSSAAHNRFYPTLGNHDWRGIRCRSDACSGAYLDYFTLPGNERYYDFVQGNVHFFSVDSEPSEPDGIASDSRQANWLMEGLAASTAAWQVVLLHHPPYSSGSHGSTRALQWPFAEWGADVVVAGHDHTYERIEHDGITYLVNGLGGRRPYDFGRPVSGSVVRYNGDHGAMRATADADRMSFQFINRRGAVVDEFEIQSVGATGRDSSIPGAEDLPQLRPPYPNPVSSTATISYDLPYPTDVHVSVFDLLGKQVRELASGFQLPGTYHVALHAGDLPNGLYFCRLEVGATVVARSMVVLR